MVVELLRRTVEVVIEGASSLAFSLTNWADDEGGESFKNDSICTSISVLHMLRSVGVRGRLGK